MESLLRSGTDSHGSSPTLCFLAFFQIMPVAYSSILQPGRTAASTPKGVTILAQHRAVDRTLIIQGRMNRWPSHSRELGWQLSPSPTATRGPGRLPEGPAKESRGWLSQLGARRGSS